MILIVLCGGCVVPKDDSIKSIRIVKSELLWIGKYLEQ